MEKVEEVTEVIKEIRDMTGIRQKICQLRTKVRKFSALKICFFFIQKAHALVRTRTIVTSLNTASQKANIFTNAAKIMFSAVKEIVGTLKL